MNQADYFDVDTLLEVFDPTEAPPPPLMTTASWGVVQACLVAVQLHCPIGDFVDWHSENRVAARGKRAMRAITAILRSDLHALPTSMATRFSMHQQGGPSVDLEALPGSPPKTSFVRDEGRWREDTVVARLANDNKPIDALYGPSADFHDACAFSVSVVDGGGQAVARIDGPPFRMTSQINRMRGRPGVIITRRTFEVRTDGTWHPFGPPPEHTFKDATQYATLADHWLPDEPVLDFFEHMLDFENYPHGPGV